MDLCANKSLLHCPNVYSFLASMFQILEIKLESSVIDRLNVPGMIDKYPSRFFHCKLIYMYARMTDISSRTTEEPHARTSKRTLNLPFWVRKHFLTFSLRFPLNLAEITYGKNIYFTLSWSKTCCSPPSTPPCTML